MQVCIGNWAAMGIYIAYISSDFIRWLFDLDVEKTHSIALNFFKLAAENGNFLAIYHLGEMFHYGHGVQAHCESAQLVCVCGFYWSRTILALV